MARFRTSRSIGATTPIVATLNEYLQYLILAAMLTVVGDVDDTVNIEAKARTSDGKE